MQRTVLTSRLTTLRSPLVLSPLRSISSSSRSSLSTSTSTTPATTQGQSSPTTPIASGSATISGGKSDSKYFIPRSQFGELPVYSDVRNGGTRVLTIIRKVHGDVSELQKDLEQFLHPSTSSFTKPQTQQVVIKGDWVREVKEWLATRGF
ncbi:hypothetical protein JCM16303_001131 [Sporobolomyces ruberrimus]